MLQLTSTALFSPPEMVYTSPAIALYRCL